MIKNFQKTYIKDALKYGRGDNAMETAMLVAVFSLVYLSEVFSPEFFSAKVLAVSNAIMKLKPRLIVSEAFHRLALSEGQKEIARRLESRAENERRKLDD